MNRSLLVLVRRLAHRLVVLHEAHRDLLFADVTDLTELRISTTHASQHDFVSLRADSLVRHGDLWHFLNLDIRQIEKLFALCRHL